VGVTSRPPQGLSYAPGCVRGVGNGVADVQMLIESAPRPA